MYQDVLGGVTPVVAGIVTLPNTGSSTLPTVLSIVSIVLGVAILATTAIRYIAKNHYNA